MNTFSHRVWIGIFVVNAFFWFVLATAPPAGADPRRPPTLPVNPATQRAEMVRELTEIKELLKEQNRLLQTSKRDSNVTK